MRTLIKILSLASIVLLMTDCRDPFQPDFKTGLNDYLVVEGFINVGANAVTKITLSRVAPIASTTQVFENDAILFIENRAGEKFPLLGEGSGTYKSASLNLSTDDEYRLLITTVTGKEYASNFTQAKVSPVIDSIHWQWEQKGIQFYVSTHDPENKTNYYKWDYTETWEFHSSYVSDYVYNNGVFDIRGGRKYEMYMCWKSARPTDLCFASTTQFEKDAIHYPLILFGHHSERTSVRYSVLVEQRVLSKDEFDYLQLIQKNSNLTGSLFDPLPSEIRGNINSLTSSNEIVIGYIGVSTTDTKRIFVTNAEFGVGPAAKCETLTVEPKDFEASFGTGVYIPIDLNDDGTVLGAPRYCMDCRLQGTWIQPDFW